MTVKRPGMAAVALAVLFCVPVTGREGEMPSGDFLEYLAALVEEDGEWVDPLELDEVSGEDLNLDQDMKAAGKKTVDDAQHVEEKP